MASRNFEKYLKGKGRASYFGVLLGLLAIGMAFLPQMGEVLLNGETVRFTSYKLIFGGEDVLSASSGTYYFTYSTNIPYIIWGQIVILGILCSALGRRSRKNILVSSLFFAAAFIYFLFSRLIVLKVNPNIPQDGLVLCYGFYLVIFFSFLGFCVQMVNYVSSRRFHQALHAVK